MPKFFDGLHFAVINLFVGFWVCFAFGHSIGMSFWPDVLMATCFGLLLGAIGFVADCLISLKIQLYNQRRGR